MNGDTSISCNLSNCDCDKPKAPHAMTREQCSLCTANRPRLCDQHYKQGADELLKHVTAAIQDQQTPGGVKATYEQLLELCNQQRQALAQQAQEIERLKNIVAYVADCQPDGKKYLDEARALSADYCDEQRQERDTARQDAARLREAALWAMKKVKRLSTRAVDYKRADDFIQHEVALKGA